MLASFMKGLASLLVFFLIPTEGLASLLVFFFYTTEEGLAALLVFFMSTQTSPHREVFFCGSSPGGELPDEKNKK